MLPDITNAERYMVNRIEIERLLQSKEMKELWQTIQQELPQLHFYEENDSWEEARIDYLENYISECNTLLCKCNFQEISIKDLYTYLSLYSFEVFCKQDLLETENTEIIIDESEQDYILQELGMSEDEYKQRCKTYDYLEVANHLVDYYLLTEHSDILLEYYKLQGYEEPEQMLKDKMDFYSMCKR